MVYLMTSNDLLCGIISAIHLRPLTVNSVFVSLHNYDKCGIILLYSHMCSVTVHKCIYIRVCTSIILLCVYVQFNIRKISERGVVFESRRNRAYAFITKWLKSKAACTMIVQVYIQ